MTIGGVNSGNYYYGARYYDPKVSVWLSVDPLAHEYPSLSPYAFTDNNPVNLIDPTGMAAVDPDGLDGDPVKPPKDDGGPERVPQGSNPHIPRPIDQGSTPGTGGGNNIQMVDCSDCPKYIGGAGMLEWVSTGGINIVKAAKGIQAVYKAYKVSKTLKAAGGIKGLLNVAKSTVGIQLQKHGSRPGSLFPKATGSSADMTAQGEKVLNGILTNPKITTTTRHHARFGEILEIKIPGGQGARFSKDGKTFIGFLEP